MKIIFILIFFYIIILIKFIFKNMEKLLEILKNESIKTALDIQKRFSIQKFREIK